MTLTPDRPHARRRTSPGRLAVATTAVGTLLAGGLAAPAVAAVALPEPVVHYAFDDDPASGRVVDSSGAGLDGTLVNPGTATSVPGAQGGALQLPGGSAAAGAYVTLPRAVLAGASDLTVSLRLRWDGTGGPWQWAYGLGSNNSRYLFSTPSNGDGLLRTAVTVGGGGAEAQVTGSAALPAEQWRTLTVTLDTTGDRVSTYLDGALVDSAPTTITASQLLTQGATGAGYIGRSFYPDPLLDGAVDDFQVFSSALTPEQVAELVGGQVPTVVQLSATTFDLRTVTGTAPALPTGVPATFTDGYDRDVPVVWDAVDPALYAEPGEFTVSGQADGTAVTAAVSVVREGELTVDLGVDTGDFLGGASGALYGLYDGGMPSENLVEGFGLRTVATKGQDGAQHPGSDALEVLGPLAAATDGKVYVRTTDYYRGFPYQWPGDTPEARLEGYFEVMAMQLDQIAAALAADPSLADNVVVEPFNEPEGNMFGTGQWSYDRTSWLEDPTDYFAAWDRAHALISETLPGVEIAGPGTSVLYGQVEGFLTHTVEAGTTPDIITWHELSNPASVRSSVERYRGWEAAAFAGTELDGTELPINVNEYAFNYHTSVPGQMIQWMSAVEDMKVEAMIAFWNLNGNLSDSAVQANRANGQWWLYNSYQAMTGRTVAVTPPQPGESYTLQGVATLDEDLRRSHVLMGGKGGKAYVQLTDVPADVFGEEVRVTVREVPWTGQIGDSPQPRHVAELVVPVVDDRVGLDFGGVELPELVESSAYEVLVTPAGTGTTTAAAPLDFEASYEAEAGRWTGGGYTRNGPEGSPQNVAGYYTSGGFDVGGLRTGSDGVLDITVEVPEDGTYDLQVFSSTLNTYAAVAENGPTNVFVRVDGGAEQELFLPLAYKWVVWDHADTTVDLTAGTHTISLAARSLDGTRSTVGDAIVDRIVLQRANPAAAASVYEAELAEVTGGTVRYDVPTAAEASGAGAVELTGDQDVTFWVYSAVDGESTLGVDTTGAGRAVLEVNGRQVRELDGAAEVPVQLLGGVNKVVVRGSGTGSVGLDRLVVDPAGEALPVTGYEAEDAALTGSASVVDLGLASGGKAVDGVGGEPGNDSSLTFTVAAERAGTHAVTVRFSNPEQVPATHYNPNPMARYAEISVNGAEGVREIFVPTFHQNQFWEKTVYVDLAAGQNTLTFTSQEETNWDGVTYADQTWPDIGLDLRADTAPIVDRISVAPFTVAAAQEPVWATDVSLADVLGADTSGPDGPRGGSGTDFDLLSVAVARVLAADPGSPVAVLADPTQPLTAFLPDDAAFLALVAGLTGRPVPNEKVAAARLRSLLGTDELEQVLLDHVVLDATLTSEQVLQADGAVLTTAGGGRVTVQVAEDGVSLLDEAGGLVARVDLDRVDVNLGQVQVGHVVDRVILLD